MISAIIVEDEPIAIKIIKGFIEATDGIELIAEFHLAEDAMEWLQNNSVDVIFQDINLPDFNGVDFIKSLANAPKIIFTTANPSYATDGFDLNAVDYLVKPISFQRFSLAIDKLITSLYQKTNKESLTFKANNRTYFIKPTEIYYFESAGDYVKVNGKDQNLVINQTMKELEKNLNSDFLRVHKSFIINTTAIQYIEGNQIKINDKMIPIGATYKDKLKLR